MDSLIIGFVFTKTGAALLVMAIAGGAVLPLLYGRGGLAHHRTYPSVLDYCALLFVRLVL